MIEEVGWYTICKRLEPKRKPKKSGYGVRFFCGRFKLLSFSDPAQAPEFLSLLLPVHFSGAYFSSVENLQGKRNQKKR